jgi:hypothetical protein
MKTPFNPLPIQYFAEHSMTVGEAGRTVYPGIVFDTALPHNWCLAMKRLGVEVYGHWVWGYPSKSQWPEAPLTGIPLPLTQEAWTNALRSDTAPYVPQVQRFLLHARAHYQEDSEQ